MSTIHIHRKIESETLHVPELKTMIGKNVKIIVQEVEEPVAEESTSPYEAFLALAGTNAVDPEAYKRLRDASQL